jgi:hypothetical protein
MDKKASILFREAVGASSALGRAGQNKTTNSYVIEIAM